MASFKGAGKRTTPPEGSEKDRWIHRDKLTQIEIQEYRDLGLEPPAELLRRAAESRAQAASREQAEALRSIRSPSPYRYDENEEYDEDEQYHERADEDDSSSIFVPVDPRSPEEIAEDPYEEGRMTPSLRKSNSKIPLAPYSLVPVPQEHLDRGQPLPRKRGASAGWDEGTSPGLTYPKTRVRKDSTASQTTPEDEQPIASSPISSPVSGPLTPSSPNKQRTPQQRSTSKTSASKKKNNGTFTTPRNASASRQRSTSATPSRPGTSSGERPRTANGPEGDPPWLATMWKPDPRLPPDQQMLPTHAKRMMQEQLEREGKSGQMYDRDFNAVQGFENEDDMLAAAENARLQHAEAIDRGASPTAGDRTAQWPLSDASFGVRDATPSPTKASINGSPGKRSVTGGYSTVPRVTDSPKPQIGLFPSPRIGSGGTTNTTEQVDDGRNPSTRPPAQQAQKQPKPQEEMGLQTRVTGGLEDDQEKDDKKKGGCGCCVVM